MKIKKIEKFCIMAVCAMLLATGTLGSVNCETVYAASGASAFYNTDWTMKGPTGIAFDLVFYSDGTWFCADYSGEWSQNIIMDTES